MYSSCFVCPCCFLLHVVLVSYRKFLAYIVNRKSLANIEVSVFFIVDFFLLSVAAKITFRSLDGQGKFSTEIKALISYLQKNDKSTCHGISCLHSLRDNSKNGRK